METQAIENQQLTLDILVYEEDGVWVADCVQLQVIHVDPDINKAFEVCKNLCRAQILYATENDPDFEHLFHPPDKRLMRIMAMASRAGVVDIEINTTHVTVNRLLAHAA